MEAAKVASKENSLWISLDSATTSEDTLFALEQLFASHSGNAYVFFKVKDGDQVRVLRSRRYRINVTPKLASEIESLLGFEQEKASIDKVDNENEGKDSSIWVLSTFDTLVQDLHKNPGFTYSLNPNQFEELVCDLLSSQGLDVARTGKINTPDGGIDILARYKHQDAIDLIIAVQVKHHKSASIKTSVGPVRDLLGVVTASRDFSQGMLVTNSYYTQNAKVFASQVEKSIKLKDVENINIWISSYLASLKTIDSRNLRIARTLLEVHPGSFS